MTRYFLILIPILVVFGCSNTKSPEEPKGSIQTDQNEEGAVSTSFQFKINTDLTGDEQIHRQYMPETSDLSPKLIESVKFDLDKDGTKDKIEFFKFDEYSGDPGEFDRIRIELANGAILDEFNLGIRNNKNKPDENEVESDLITIVEFNGQYLLITFGWYFANNPSEMTIFEFSTGKPRRLFAMSFALESINPDDNTILSGYRTLKNPESQTGPSIYSLIVEGQKPVLKRGS